MSAPPRDLPPRIAEEHVEELSRLTDTAGGEVLAAVFQRLDAPNPKTFIGAGKVDELRERVQELDANLVIFDDELSPAQGKALEDQVGVRVMDRSELILDIFATRARSRESKLQVELAQLEYLLPRLKRMWSHLSRIRGGIGLRGPGETQIETDRRLIARKISDLKEKLRGVAASRATQRKSREGTFRAALVGYTNAGKSSLLRALSGADVFVEDRLFATLDPTTRAVPIGEGQEVLVTDTVGFIRKLPHHLVASFRSTLEEAREADLILHVIDLSHSDWEEQLDVVDRVLGELQLGEKPQVLVFNKVDRLTHAEEEAARERIRATEARPAIFVSALEEDSLEALRELLRARIQEGYEEARLSLPTADGQAMALLYRDGIVISREDHDGKVVLRVRAPGALLGWLRKRSGVHVHSGAIEA